MPDDVFDLQEHHKAAETVGAAALWHHVSLAFHEWRVVLAGRLQSDCSGHLLGPIQRHASAPMPGHCHRPRQRDPRALLRQLCGAHLAVFAANPRLCSSCMLKPVIMGCSSRSCCSYGLCRMCVRDSEADSRNQTLCETRADVDISWTTGWRLRAGWSGQRLAVQQRTAAGRLRRGGACDREVCAGRGRPAAPLVRRAHRQGPRAAGRRVRRPYLTNTHHLSNSRQAHSCWHATCVLHL